MSFLLLFIFLARAAVQWAETSPACAPVLLAAASQTQRKHEIAGFSLLLRLSFHFCGCLKVSSCLMWDLWLPLRLLKQSHKIGRKCLFDANPDKSDAVRGRSLRCLRVLAQTCLMSWSADIYSAAASCIYIKRERERERGHTAECSWNMLCRRGETCTVYRLGSWSDQVDRRESRQRFPTFDPLSLCSTHQILSNYSDFFYRI